MINNFFKWVVFPFLAIDYVHECSSTHVHKQYPSDKTQSLTVSKFIVQNGVYFK